MHISEGYLSGPVLVSGAALAVAGTAIGLKKLDYDRVAQAGILAAAFFVASLVHVPLGPFNIHLTMNGIVGLLLGWGAFPVILVALILQGFFFQFGGITTLGVNTIIMAAPAVSVYYLFGRRIHRHDWTGKAAAFGCGAVAIVLATGIMAASLMFTEKRFLVLTGTAVIGHLLLMVIEGLISVVCVAFLAKVKPELLPKSMGERKTS